MAQGSEKEGGRRQARTAGAAALAVAVVAFVVYAATAAPGLSWEHNGADGGDLAAAVAVWGVPHPPGYPTYVLLGRLWSTLVPLHDVAFRLNLFSAACAALTTGLVFLIILRLCRDGEQAVPDRPAYVAALAGALGFAFSAVFWSQAVIAEVYALNALFVAGLLLAVLAARLDLAFLVLGLGLGNHLSLALLAPSLALLAPRRPRLGLRSLAALLAGLAVYLYLPLAAARQPAINWGNPGTAEGLAWMLLGGPYRSYLFGLPWAELPSRLSAWAGLIVRQLGWPGVALALLGLWGMFEQAPGRRRAWALVLAFALYSLYALGYRTADSFVFLIPAFLIAALWLGRGFYDAALVVQEWGRSAGPGRPSPWQRGMPLLLTVIILLYPALQLQANYAAQDLSRDQSARAYIRRVLAEAPAASSVITGSDQHTFALWYAVATERPHMLVIDRDLTQFEWYRNQLRRAEPALQAAPDSGEPEAYLPGLVSALAGRRPVYLADEDVGLLARFSWQEAGGLWRLLP